MEKFKVGDRVRLKRSMQPGEKIFHEWGTITLTEGMMFTGEREVRFVDDDDTLLLKDSGLDYFYSFDMLDLVEEGGEG